MLPYFPLLVPLGEVGCCSVFEPGVQTSPCLPYSQLLFIFTSWLPSLTSTYRHTHRTHIDACPSPRWGILSGNTQYIALAPGRFQDISHFVRRGVVGAFAATIDVRSRCTHLFYLERGTCMMIEWKSRCRQKIGMPPFRPT